APPGEVVRIEFRVLARLASLHNELGLIFLFTARSYVARRRSGSLLPGAERRDERGSSVQSQGSAGATASDFPQHQGSQPGWQVPHQDSPREPEWLRAILGGRGEPCQRW